MMKLTKGDSIKIIKSDYVGIDYGSTNHLVHGITKTGLTAYAKCCDGNERLLFFRFDQIDTLVGSRNFYKLLLRVLGFVLTAMIYLIYLYGVMYSYDGESIKAIEMFTCATFVYIATRDK